MKEKELLEAAFHSEGWEAVVQVEKNLRDDYFLQLARLSLDDPAFERKAASLQGGIQMIHKIWLNRDRIRSGDAKSERKKHERNEAKKNEDFVDEDDLDFIE